VHPSSKIEEKGIESKLVVANRVKLSRKQWSKGNKRCLKVFPPPQKGIMGERNKGVHESNKLTSLEMNLYVSTWC
jgi:hypothetical protein